MAFLYFDTCCICHLISGKYQNKEKPLKRQKRLGISNRLKVEILNLLQDVLEYFVDRSAIPQLTDRAR